MKPVYFVKQANTNKDKAESREGQDEGYRTGDDYNKIENVCFQSVEVGVRLAV